MAFRLPFVSQILSQWVSTALLNWEILPPKGHLAMSGDILGGHNWGRSVLLLASSRWRPGRLPNTTENYPAPNVSAAEAENTGHTDEEAQARKR